MRSEDAVRRLLDQTEFRIQQMTEKSKGDPPKIKAGWDAWIREEQTKAETLQWVLEVQS